MMSFINSMSMTKKLSIPLIVLVCGFLFYGWYSFRTLNKLKVNGPVYTEIVLGKDLIADILPPPDFIIESYLMAFELRESIDDDSKTVELEKYVLGKLRKEYFDRHEFWLKDELFLGDSPEIKNKMCIESYQPVEDFYNIFETKFLPAIKSKDRELASSILSNELKPRYLEHRKNIDQVVSMAAEKNIHLEKESAQIIKTKSLQLLIVLLVSMLIGIAVFVSIMRLIFKSLDAVNSRIKDIAEGDLTKRVEIKTYDEIGTLSQHFNQLVEKIQYLVNDVKITTGIVSDLTVNVRQFSNASKDNLHNQGIAFKETAATVEKIASSAADISSDVESQASAIYQSNQSIENLVVQAKTMSSEGREMAEFVASTSATIDQTIDSIKDIVDKISLNSRGLDKVITNMSSLTNNISNTSAAIEEMSVSIAENTNNLNRATGIVNTSLEKADDGKNIVEQTIQAMQNITGKVKTVALIIDGLKHSSHEIGEIVSVIDGIAEQTNLLALNAAIEAARAGEAGKGFAVVADEIRKLAEKTSLSTTKIAQTVKTIQENTDKSVSAMNDGQKEVEKGVDFVSSTGEAFNAITDSIHKINEIMTFLNNNSREQNIANTQISGLSIDMSKESIDSFNETKKQVEQFQKVVAEIERVNTIIAAINTIKMGKSVGSVEEMIVGMSSSLEEMKLAVNDINYKSLTIRNNSEQQSSATKGITRSISEISSKNSTTIEDAEKLNDLLVDLEKNTVELTQKISFFKS